MRRILLLALVLMAHTANAQSWLDAAMRDVDTLASPVMAGRGYEGDGHLRAAAYIESAFREAGLQPTGAGYRQPFTFTVDLVRGTPELHLNGRSIPPGRGFLPIASSPSASYAGDARLVRAGAGLYAPEAGINDYAGVDAAGAIVVLEEALPTPAPEGMPPAARTLLYRVEAAAAMGARAVFFLSETLSHGPFPQNTSIPGFLIQRGYWPEVGIEGSRDVAYTLTTAQDVPTETHNVVAFLPGTELPDRYLLVTAHFDHVGQLGPQVYFPGANDNASGVAMILSLARHFAREPLRRSLLFVAFSGEEQGLIGSRVMAAEPPVPLTSIDFLLNMDMVASGQDGVMAVGGADFPDAFALLTASASTGDASGNVGRIGKRPNAPNSDHYPFLMAGVPGFFLYTNRGTQPYHSVDDVPETLEWDDFEAVFELSRAFLRRFDAGD
ncbi:MAG: M28 family peptidase [Rhodothermales bacterium]|nr:M28 family peptidase [Rhodothermales bacterium]